MKLNFEGWGLQTQLGQVAYFGGAPLMSKVLLHVASSLALCFSLVGTAVHAELASFEQPLKFEHFFNIGSAGVNEGQFQYIEDFAFSKDGHLLVTDASHAWVQVFDRTSGKGPFAQRLTLSGSTRRRPHARLILVTIAMRLRPHH